MPEQLENYEFTGARTGGYDWDTLLNGSIYRLVKGTDFSAKPNSFLTTVRKQAEKRNMAVKSQIENDETIVIQGLPGQSAE